MSSNEPVAPESPNDRRSANEVGEWHTREQLSMLLVPIAARIRRDIAKQSSLVARDEASPAIAFGPCSALMRLKLLRDPGDRLFPGRDAELAVLADQRGGQGVDRASA